MAKREKPVTVSREELTKIKTPKATRSWTPTPHHELLALFQKEVEGAGYKVLQERHQTLKAGARYFGHLVLERTAKQAKAAGDLSKAMSLMIGIRNSHDRTLSASGLVGSYVFVCANGAFSGEEKFTRRHTVNVERYLPDEVKTIVGRLVDRFAAQDARMLAYQQTELDTPEKFIIDMLDGEAISGEDIPHVLREWRSPSYPEFVEAGPSVWRMFNSFTDRYKSVNAFDLPRRTEILHRLADKYAGVETQP